MCLVRQSIKEFQSKSSLIILSPQKMRGILSAEVALKTKQNKKQELS